MHHFLRTYQAIICLTKKRCYSPLMSNQEEMLLLFDDDKFKFVDPTVVDQNQYAPPQPSTMSPIAEESSLTQQDSPTLALTNLLHNLHLCSVTQPPTPASPKLSPTPSFSGDASLFNQPMLHNHCQSQQSPKTPRYKISLHSTYPPSSIANSSLDTPSTTTSPSQWR